jgi:hypothetical protein
MEVIPMSSNVTRTPSTTVTRASSKRAWLAAPAIAGLLLTGCASHDPATAGPHPTPTHPINCPPGTHQRSGDCLANGTAAQANPPPDRSPTCPPDTHLRAGECLNNGHITSANDD